MGFCYRLPEEEDQADETQSSHLNITKVCTTLGKLKSTTLGKNLKAQIINSKDSRDDNGLKFCVHTVVIVTVHSK